MSKPVKSLIINDYAQKFDGVTDAMVISIRGVNAINTTKLRGKLAKKNIRVTVVRNALARKTLSNTGLAPLEAFLKGSSALAYGGQSVVEVAREIVAMLKEIPSIELKGAVLDGQVFEGKAGVEELSKYPTREEAVGRVVTLLLGPARNLAAQIAGPAATVAGLVKAIEDKLEKGEAVAKIAG